MDKEKGAGGHGRKDISGSGKRMLLAGVFALAMLWLCFARVVQAEDISSPGKLTENFGVPEAALLFDMDLETAQKIPSNAYLTLEDNQGIAAAYLIFDREYGCLTLTAEEGGEAVIDTGGVLHFFVDLESCFGYVPRRVSLCFSDGEASVNELRIFSEGELPDWVQQWQLLPDGGADLVLFSTHGDDEQLFFAGLLPYYGAEKGYQVQVVYFTDHRNMTLHRVHEMLNGLWAVGIRNYPVFGSFADYYTFSMEDAYRFYEEQNLPEEKLLSFVVEQLRRYRPLVAVGHDVNGEYGHGMHKLYTDLLQKAVQLTMDPEQFPNLAEAYGVWDVPKTYLHLYSENQVNLEWDIPLESFDGKTAYEVTRDLGFASHASQQKDFAWYFRDSNKASEIGKYNPCRYGLYRTTVGEDILKNDFFENLGPKVTESPIPGPTAEQLFPPESPKAEAGEPGSPAERGLSSEKGWLLFPAVGTLVLAVMTTCLNLPTVKENFKNE